VLDRVTGRQKARTMPGVYEVYIKPTRGQRLRVPKSMGHRYAYVIAYGETMDHARETAKQAAAEITFQLVPV
jgi:biotin carboxylase